MDIVEEEEVGEWWRWCYAMSDRLQVRLARADLASQQTIVRSGGMLPGESLV